MPRATRTLALTIAACGVLLLAAQPAAAHTHGDDGGGGHPAGEPPSVPMTANRVALNVSAFAFGALLFCLSFTLLHHRPFGRWQGYGLMRKWMPEGMWDALSEADQGPSRISPRGIFTAWLGLRVGYTRPAQGPSVPFRSDPSAFVAGTG